MAKSAVKKQPDLKRLKILIDHVGELHESKKAAETLYAAERKVLTDELKAAVGIDVWVQGKKYRSALVREKETLYDVVEFLDKVDNDALRRELLTVRITAAKKVLSPATVKEVFTEGYAENPTLYVKPAKEE